MVWSSCLIEKEGEGEKGSARAGKLQFTKFQTGTWEHWKWEKPFHI